MYEFNYQDPYEQQQANLQQLGEQFAPQTDFGRVSMGQAPTQGYSEEQANTAYTMDEANLSSAEGVGEAVRDARSYQYTTEGATDTEALGEGMFAFGLAMLAASSRPGANFGDALAQGLGQGAKSFTGALNRNKRFENREALEAKGFTQESIDAYIASGDNKVLVKSEGKADWTAPNKDGYMTNKLTGEVKQAYERPTEDDWSTPTAAGWTINSKTGEARQVHQPTARGSGTGTGTGRGSAGKQKWETGLYEYKDPETGAMRVKEYTFDGNAGPTERVYYEGGQAVPGLPEGGKFTSETQQRLRAENRTKAEEKTGTVGINVAGAVNNIRKLNDNAIHLLNLNRYNPWSESYESSNTADQAKSALMVQQYSTMPGVAGASVQTEEALIKAIPTKFQTEKGIAEWSLDRLSYDETVIKASIRQQQRAYEYHDPSLDDALASIQQERSRLRTKLENLNKPKEKKKGPTKEEIRNATVPPRGEETEEDHSDMWN